MNRWKLLVTHHWRAKIVSLLVAALLWLAIRHAMRPSPPGAASIARPRSLAAISA